MDAALTSKESLTATINKLFGCSDDSFHDFFSTLFSTKIQAVVNDETMDYDGLRASFEKLRDGPKLSANVLDLVKDGRNYAWRHVVEGTLPDGNKMVVKIFLFGELDEDGKVLRQTESVRS